MYLSHIKGPDKLNWQSFKHQAPMFNLEDLIKYLDQNPNLKKLISQYVEKGYESMYL